MPDELKNALNEFVQFAQTLRGDEKSEAQPFLDRFFRALGHKGVIQAGATFEYRVAKKPGSPQLELIKGNGAPSQSKGGKKFADLLWPDRVLIEMKSRGEKLERYYDQLFEYWTHIVPKRPPYAILCNFDEFWIYDFNTQLFDPVDRVALPKVAENWRAFAYMLPHKHEPKFDNDRVEVTRVAADLMARVFRQIVLREDRQRAQRFILQLLVAMVAEDIGLLPSDIVTDLLFQCSEKNESSYDLFGGLFLQMQSKEPARAGRFKDVQYFNGGLFEIVEPIELKRAEVYALYDAASHNDWSKVRPEIFGTLFQDSMDKKERHAYGGHFTSEFDIQKVVGPTIVRPWRQRIEAAGNNVGELRKTLADLRKFRVLDPACGSGNFLFIAYREMKRLERDILVQLKKARAHEELTSTISLQNFFGIDILSVAVEIAKVTLMLAKELEIIEAAKLGESEGLFVHEHPLPLDNLDENIIRADALFTDWPKADAIIGNPPYLGSRYLAQEHGYAYARKIYARFPDVPKMADFCTYWFRLAHDALPEGGRAGLVGTNTVRQGETREASLDYIVRNGGAICEAVSTQKWSGEAAVSVSIVNWVKGKCDGKKTLYTQEGDRADSPWKIEQVDVINSALANRVDLSEAKTLTRNRRPKVCFTGQNPANNGFTMQIDDAARMIHASADNKDVVVPYLIGDDIVSVGQPSSWIVDFGTRTLFDAKRYKEPFAWIQERVMPDVIARADEEKRATGKESTRWTRMAARWWQFRDVMPGTMKVISRIPRYIAIPRVTKRPIFEFIDSRIHPDSAVVVFAFADDYSFGVIQSSLHCDWFKARCSTLEGRFRYTSNTVFNAFPWPQKPTLKQIKVVAEVALALRALRRDAMRKLNYTLRDLYRTLEQPGDNPLHNAQARLDAAVRAAYGMPADIDPLTFLLELNLACSAKEKAGKQITPPGLPLPLADRASFITSDCIQPPVLS
jgi:hypothetical protein